jgi:adenosylcobinamide kinase/adenosylcobinamide-phosphate guanylyltransferase
MALPEGLRRIEGTALVDSLGTWVARHHDFDVDAAALVDALTGRRGDTIVVSEEVGLGVHPATAVGRRFRDALGGLNQAVGAVADEVVLVVAGRTLSLGGRP